MMAPTWTRAARPLVAVCLAVALLSLTRADAQKDEPPPKLPAGPDILPPDYGGSLSPAVPVALLDVLRLAAVANLDIAQAQLFVDRARVAVTRARSLYLPNFEFGSTYVTHDGRIQRVEGTVINANRSSLFVGLRPSLTANFSDALFVPREFVFNLQAARAGQARVTNETLLRVAEAYFNVLLARRRLARLDETLDFLTSTQPSELRGGSQGLLPIIKAFVRAGTALPSDQARVEADVVRRQEERVRALQDVRTTSAELARLLQIDPTVFLLPVEDYRWPLDIPGQPWAFAPMDELVGQGLRARPELAENSALIASAVARYRGAKWRPYVPNLVVGYSWGGFGGGPDIVGTTPRGGAILGGTRDIQDFGVRGDLDVSLVWRLQGLGIGNLAQVRDARLRIEQRQLEQLQIQYQVIAQIVQALEQVHRGRQRVDITRTSLFDERGRPTGTVYRSLLLNFTRIKGGQGLPLEVLDSTRRLSDVLEGYALSLTDYDRARFRLLFALGMPADALLDPLLMPMPCSSAPAEGAPSGAVPDGVAK